MNLSIQEKLDEDRVTFVVAMWAGDNDGISEFRLCDTRKLVLI